MPAADTKTEQLIYALGHRGASTAAASGCCNTKTQSYLLDAIARVNQLQDDLEAWKNSPDVVDIVATYADLQSYDTSSLTDKDIVRVLSDNTQDGATTYYRWTISGGAGSWVYVGKTIIGQPEEFVFTLADSTTVTKNIMVA